MRAFICGISAYFTLNKLNNAVNDARVFAATMKRHGAVVYDIYDEPLALIQKKFEEFVRDLRKGDIAFVFFAGHGCQWRSKQLLIAKAMDPEEAMLKVRPAETIPEKSMKVEKMLGENTWRKCLEKTLE